MRCAVCHAENPPQAKFCLECAAPFARACMSCGTQLPANARFCGLGKLYRAIGRLDEARAELETAGRMLREMGMNFWLPEADAALAEM
jgi:predicted amidophosphoribosyltransferase